MVKISDIWYYGKSYSEKVIWWFCKIDEKIYQTEEILYKFNFTDEYSIIQSNCYIPLFKTDIVSLEKEYMQTLPYNIQKSFDKNFKTNSFDSYDLAFKEFLDTYSYDFNYSYNWYEFEEKRLKNDAIIWCKQNSINYKNEKRRPQGRFYVLEQIIKQGRQKAW
ncbi:MAG: hypothetical protein IKJ00_03970 [Clostridia bacterium]|nr:hypothetical protein [Clostridia bacterium]